MLEQFERAAQLSSQVLGNDRLSWEEWLDVFLEHKQLTVRSWGSAYRKSAYSIQIILPHIPLASPQLSISAYERVLETLLLDDQEVNGPWMLKSQLIQI
jgi:hypothetical protein